jgi:hypothetical protein
MRLAVAEIPAKSLLVRRETRRGGDYKDCGNYYRAFHHPKFLFHRYVILRKFHPGLNLSKASKSIYWNHDTPNHGPEIKSELAPQPQRKFPLYSKRKKEPQPEREK